MTGVVGKGENGAGICCPNSVTGADLASKI